MRFAASKKTEFVLAFGALYGEPKTHKSSLVGDMTMHQFNLGEVVTCGVRYAAPGDYKILAFMPDSDGERMYRIKSPLEEHQRVVKESVLARSAGELWLDEVPRQRPPRRSITLARAPLF